VRQSLGRRARRRRRLVLFDGRAITVLDADAGVYAQAPQPGSIDDTLGYFVRDLRMRMPRALLMTTRLPSVLADVVKSIDYVESTEILGAPTRHIAGRTENVDFLFWINDGASPLPLRVVVTCRLSPGQPQFWANFADWNVSPQLSQATFELAQLPASKQIPFAVQVSRSTESNQRPGANWEIEP